MDLPQAIEALNTSLHKEKPRAFGSTWIARRLPRVHRFIGSHVRSPLGDIDWDAVVRKLDRPLQRRWVCRRPRKVRPYSSIGEVQKLLRHFSDKRYVFLSVCDKGDSEVRDALSVALVRLAQKGNVYAWQELLDLLRYTVGVWVESHVGFKRWLGHTQELEDHVKGCIRRYRFTGSFIGYLYCTLLYAARGLPPPPFSLDETLLEDERRKVESVVQDPQTGEITLWRRSG